VPAASKYLRDVLAPHKAKMKLTRLSYAVGFVDELCFRNGDEFIEQRFTPILLVRV
jgi:hypothetical protein